MVKRVQFVEPLLDTPVVDSELMLECMTFKDAQGHAQLLCILNGESSSFKISCQDDGSCEFAKRKIRFVGHNFFSQIQEICINTETSKLHKLCSLLQHEITEGRAIFEQTARNGERHVIASPTIAQLLQNGGLEIKSKKGKTLNFAKINCAGDSFFKVVANSFGSSIQSVLKYHEQFMRNNQLIEKTSPEGVRIEQEAKIATKTQSSFSIWDCLSSFADAFKKLFYSNETALKTQESFYVHQRVQAAEKRAIEEERKSREQDNERFESRRQERKRDDARYEVRREEANRSALRQEARIFNT